MRIGEISKQTGLSKDTIRFYEKKGLIQVGRTDSDWNNYKFYDDNLRKRLLLIKKAKGFGFTLNEIAEILDLVDLNTANCDTMAVQVEEKLRQIDEKISDLKAMKQLILQKMEKSMLDCMPKSEKSNCNLLSEL